MRGNKSSSDDPLEEPRTYLRSATRRDNGVVSTKATNPLTAHQPEKNAQKFQPRRIDLTPEAPVNIGYVGGIRMPNSDA